MNLFLKAAEIWIPDKSGRLLTLVSSEYGELDEFANVSSDMTFSLGEGLPGQTWQQKVPLIWTDLSNSYFQRSEIAQQSGITCGLSIPIIFGEFVNAIVILFFGSSSGEGGAVEVWYNHDGSHNELKLLDGFYGDLERFEYVSRRLTLMRGRGLPGVAWETEKPLVIGNLAESNTFIRARNAAESGITTGMAIPLNFGDEGVKIVTFLSAMGTPIALRFEVWLPHNERSRLLFHSGFSITGDDLQERYRDEAFNKGEGLLGGSWLSGQPVLEQVGDFRELAIPLIQQGQLSAIVRLIF
ncbi:MAG: GAF domain-containing protein [Pseudomonadales bacterium]|nr:GAF domain-containing protein [Pseudomonadales bacterium]